MFISKIQDFTDILQWGSTEMKITCDGQSPEPSKIQRPEHIFTRDKSTYSTMYRNWGDAPARVEDPSIPSSGINPHILRRTKIEKQLTWKGVGPSPASTKGPSIPSSVTNTHIPQRTAIKMIQLKAQTLAHAQTLGPFTPSSGTIPHINQYKRVVLNLNCEGQNLSPGEEYSA